MFHLLKVNNKNTSKKVWNVFKVNDKNVFSGVFIVNFEHISNHLLVFIVDFEQVTVNWVFTELNIWPTICKSISYIYIYIYIYIIHIDKNLNDNHSRKNKSTAVAYKNNDLEWSSKREFLWKSFLLDTRDMYRILQSSYAFLW